MSKLLNFRKTVELCGKYIKQGKKVGLVTGCFDVVHIGHIELLEFAASKCDVLVVGLDTDKTIRMTKGIHRPVFNFKQRVKVIAALENVDSVFQLPHSFLIHQKNSKLYKDLLSRLNPSCLISSSYSDSMFDEKNKLCQELNIELIDDKKAKMYSSSKIIKSLGLN